MARPHAESAVPGSCVIHLSLTDFIAVVAENRPEVVSIQTAKVPRLSSGILVGEDYIGYLTVPVDHVIHALTLHLESIYDSPKSQEFWTAVIARVDQIRSRLHTEFSAHGAICQGGMALVPGLREDMKHFQGAQAIWRIAQRTMGDVLTRSIEWL